MDSRPLIKLPPRLAERCRSYGADVVRRYSNGENAASLAVSSHGAERNAHLQALARAGECAFCLWAGLDPDRDLNWSGTCDPGFDIEFCGIRFDLKTTRPNGRFLIWPVRKNFIFAAKQFDVLALAKLESLNCCELVGWMTKGLFWMEKQIAGDDHVLTRGTWFVEENELLPFSRSNFARAI